MNSDTMALLVLLLFPVGVGAMVAVFWRLAYRMQTIVCPACEERFPQSDIRPSGVTCMHCGWGVRSIDDPSREENGEPT